MLVSLSMHPVPPASLTCLLSETGSNSHVSQTKLPNELVSPHPHTVGAQSQGHLTQRMYNSTGQHTLINCPFTIMHSGRRYRSLFCRRARYGKKKGAYSRSRRQQKEINKTPPVPLCTYPYPIIVVVFFVQLFLTVGMQPMYM